MSTSVRSSVRLVPTVGVAALLCLAAASQAGPPLVCHPFEIGEHASLPWGDGASWRSTSSAYGLDQLPEDTLALLESEAPVLVRMETLRRASVYTRDSPETAHRLLSLLMARVLDAEAGDGIGALAWFDAGYFVEAYKQAALIRDREVGGDGFSKLDGYPWIVRAISLAGEEPGMELGAALVHYRRPEDHLEKALRLAERGTLLRRNIESRFPNR